MTLPISLPLTYTNVHHVLLAQPDLAAVGTDVIEHAAAMAEAEINGHLAGRYLLPLVSVPTLLTTLATDLAIYRIYTARMFTAPPRPVEAPWLDRYKAAVAILLRLGSGEMVLVDAAGVPLPSATSSTTGGEVWSTTMKYTPTFWEGDDRGFLVDRDKLANELGRRG